MTCYQKGRLASCSGKTSCYLLAILNGGSCRGDGINCSVKWQDGNAYCDFGGGCAKALIHPASTVPDSLLASDAPEAEASEQSRQAATPRVES